MKVYHEEEQIAELIHDPDCENPRDYAVSQFLSKHDNRREFGDVQLSEDSLMSELEERINSGNYWVFPVYAYIHGDVAFKMNPFECRWDSGMVGFICCEKHVYDTEEDAKKAMMAELETYALWVNGQCFGWSTEKDSCFGYYGVEGALGGLSEATGIKVDDMDVRD